MLLSVVRELPPRDRCLITTQRFTGFRISEILSLTVGSVLRNGEVVGKIGVAPRNMKGGYGRTRWTPVLPELHRAMFSYLGWLRMRFELSPGMPLFISREADGEGIHIGRPRPIKNLWTDLEGTLTRGCAKRCRLQRSMCWSVCRIFPMRFVGRFR